MENKQTYNELISELHNLNDMIFYAVKEKEKQTKCIESLTKEKALIHDRLFGSTS